MKKHLLFFFTSLLFFSCRDKVDINHPDIIEKPVINSILVAGSRVSIHVSLTTAMNKTEIRGIENAVIDLYVDNVFAEVLLPDDEPGWFISELEAQPGKSYSLTVRIPGFESVTACTSIPPPSALLNVHHVAIAGKERHGETYPAVQFTFENKPEEELYFEAHIRLFRSNNYESKGQLKNIIDSVLLKEGIPQLLFNNLIIKDKQYTMHVNYTTGSHSSDGKGPWVTNLYPLVIELRSISKEYYHFTRQKYLYETGRSPVYGIGANVAFPLYSNVEGGYGIVAGYSCVVSDTIKPSY